MIKIFILKFSEILESEIWSYTLCIVQPYNHTHTYKDKEIKMGCGAVFSCPRQICLVLCHVMSGPGHLKKDRIRRLSGILEEDRAGTGQDRLKKVWQGNRC